MPYIRVGQKGCLVSTYHLQKAAFWWLVGSQHGGWAAGAQWPANTAGHLKVLGRFWECVDWNFVAAPLMLMDFHRKWGGLPHGNKNKDHSNKGRTGCQWVTKISLPRSSAHKTTTTSEEPSALPSDYGWGSVWRHSPASGPSASLPGPWGTAL